MYGRAQFGSRRHARGPATVPIAACAALIAVAAAPAAQEAAPLGPVKTRIVGDRLISDTRVTATPLDAGQILLPDFTSLTVGGGSDIVIDRYEYDPETRSGTLEITVVRGVLRVIGGQVARDGEIIVRTPLATIATKEGMAALTVADDGSTAVMHAAGAETRVRGAEGELILTRPNALAFVTPGEPPRYRGVASEADVGVLYASSHDRAAGRTAGGAPVLLASLEESGGPAPRGDCGTSVSRREYVRCEDDMPETVPRTGIADLPRAGLGVSDIPTSGDGGGFLPPPGGGNGGGGGGTLVPGIAVIAGQPVGGLLFTPAGATTFIDSADVSVADPGLSGVLTSKLSATFVDLGDFSPGFPVIARFDGAFGDVAIVPPQSGDSGLAFAFPFGGANVSGVGFVDFPSALLFAQGFVGDASAPFTFVASVTPGAGSYFGVDAASQTFTTAYFAVFPDFNVAGSSSPALAFLPKDLALTFVEGGAQAFGLVAPPGIALDNVSLDTPTGARWLFTQFSLAGEGADQRQLLSVGAGDVLGGGVDGGPRMRLSADGALRLDASGPAFDLRRPLALATFQAPGLVEEQSVFGLDGDYVILTEATGGSEATAPLVGTLRDPATGGVIPFGGTHLAHFEGATRFLAGDRLPLGLDGADYAALTGLAGNPSRRYLTGGYASGAGFAVGPALAAEKFLLRSETGGGVRASFDRASPAASLVLDLEEGVTVGAAVDGTRLAFGGANGAVIDQARFGLQDHPNQSALAGELVAAGEPAGFVSGGGGRIGGADFGGALLSHGLAPTSGLFPDGADATPQYLTWGWWTGAQTAPTNASGALRDADVQYGLGAWVAGVRSVTLPMTGVASYDGAVALNVLDPSGADYVDGGRFHLSYDFGAGSGTATFSELLGAPPIGVGVGAAQATPGNHYGGGAPVPSLGAQTALRVDGSFFDGPAAGDARATAGSVRLTSPAGGVQGAGVYWGER